MRFFFLLHILLMLHHFISHLLIQRAACGAHIADQVLEIMPFFDQHTELLSIHSVGPWRISFLISSVFSFFFFSAAFIFSTFLKVASPPEATADQKSRLDMLVQKVLNVGIDSKAQIQERTKEKVGKVMKETEEIKGKFMDIKKFTLADKRGKPIKEELEMEKKKRQMLLDEIKRLGEAKEEMSNDDDEPFENLMKEIDKLFEEADENRKLQKEADKEIATAATRQDAVFNEEMEEIEKFLSDIRNADKLQL
ncbi:Protein CBG25084, partial [Caenorhabditis briggsae]